MKNNDLLETMHLARKHSKARKRTDTETVHSKVYDKYADCELCNGTLYKADGSMCSCMKDYMLNCKMSRSNIGEKYRYTTLSFYKKNMKDMYIQFRGDNTSKNVSFFIKYLQLYIDTFQERMKDGRGFLLCGDTGCGKTGALCFILRKLALKNYDVYYIDTNELLETISASYDNTNEEAKREALLKLNKLKQVELLVLDDFGSEYAKSLDWLYNTFLKLLKTRYSQNKPTLMSTNLSEDTLMDKFSEDVAPRLSSVFSEMFEIITLHNTKDMRKVKGKRNSLYEDMLEEVGE